MFIVEAARDQPGRDGQTLLAADPTADAARGRQTQLAANPGAAGVATGGRGRRQEMFTVEAAGDEPGRRRARADGKLLPAAIALSRRRVRLRFP